MKCVHIMPFTHHDLSWLGTQEECLSRGNRIITLAIRQVASIPEFTFHLEDMVFVDNYIRTNPNMVDQLISLIKDGRIELGPRWIGLYEDFQPGENFVRNLLLGKNFINKFFNIDPRCISMTDIPGHTAQFPQILQKAGVDFVLMSRSGPKGTYLFSWKGLDESEVLVFDLSELFMGYSWALFRGLNSSLQEMDKLGFSEDLYKAYANYPCDDFLISAGADLLPPLEFLDKNMRDWNDNEVGKSNNSQQITMQYSTLARFYQNIKMIKILPTYHGDVTNTWCYLEPLVVHMFQLEQLISHQLVTAEELTTIAWLNDYLDYPAELFERTWKGLLIAEDHNYDGQGSEVGDYRKLTERQKVQYTASEQIKQSFGLIAEKVSVPNEKCIPIVVFNPLIWERNDIVTAHFTSYWRGTADLEWDILSQSDKFVLKDSDNKIIPFQIVKEVRRHTRDITFCFIAEDVPSMGYSTYTLEPIKEAPVFSTKQQFTENAEVYFLENSTLKIKIDKISGGISIHDLENNELLIDEARIVEIEEDEKTNFCNDYATGKENYPKLKNVEIIGDVGPVSTTIILSYQFDNEAINDLKLELILYEQIKRVDISVEIEYSSVIRNRIELKFPTPFKHPQVIHGVPFGVNDRINRIPESGPVGSYDRDNLMTQESWEKTCLVQNWIDLSENGRGLMISTDRQLFRVESGILSNVLIRFSGYAGRFKSHFSIIPHQGEWKKDGFWQNGWSSNNPLIPYTVNDTVSPKYLPSRQSFFQITNGNVVVSAVKQSEDHKDVILRLYETTGQKATLDLHSIWIFDRIERVDLLEANGEIVDPRALTIHPFEILTLRLSRR